MKNNDLMTIVTVALTTAVLTVINFWPATLDADDHDTTPTTTIAQPKLVARGIEMALATAHGRTFGAGEEPLLELTAANTTGDPATVSANLALTSSSPSDMMSRVPRLPKALWQQNLPIALQPNETRTFTIPVPVKLPPASMIAVTLGETHPNEATADANPDAKPVPHRAGLPPGGIVALRFSTAAPVLQTASNK